MADVGQVKFRVGVSGQKQFSKEINTLSKQVNSSSGLSGSFAKLGGVIAAAFSIKAIVSFSKACIDLGSDLAEVQNVVDVTFKTLNGDVNEFAKNAASAYGLSETMAKRYMGTLGSMASAFGFSEQQAKDMAETLTGLTGDVASFCNISQDQVYTKLKSVFTGETASLKELGVVMTQTALDEYAMRNGFGKTTKQMTEQEKVALRLAFVTDSLSYASGDFARTSSGWANQTRILSLQWESLKANLGDVLINILLPMLQYLNKILATLVAATNQLKEFVNAWKGIENTTSNGGGTIISDLAGDYDDLSESIDKATKASFGFDNLNKLNGSASVTPISSSITTTTPTTNSISGLGGDEKKTFTWDFKILNQDSVKKLKEIIDDLLKRADSMSSTFQGSLQRIHSSFSSWINTNWKADCDAVKESINGSFGLFSDLYESAIKPSLDALEKQWDYIFGEGGTIDRDVSSLQDSIDRITQNCSWLTDALAIMAAGIMEYFVALGMRIALITDFVIDAGTVLAEWISGWFVLIQGICEGNLNKIGDGLKVILDSHIQGLIAIIKPFTKIIDELLGTDWTGKLTSLSQSIQQGLTGTSYTSKEASKQAKNLLYGYNNPTPSSYEAKKQTTRTIGATSMASGQTQTVTLVTTLDGKTIANSTAKYNNRLGWTAG